MKQRIGADGKGEGEGKGGKGMGVNFYIIRYLLSSIESQISVTCASSKAKLHIILFCFIIL